MNPKALDPIDYSIEYCIKDRPITESGDHWDIFQEFKGKVVYCPGALTANKNVTVGRVRGVRVDLGECVNRNTSAFDVIDSFSGALCDAYSSVFDLKTEDPFEDLDIDLGDLLVIDEIRIAPKFRGKNLGLAVMIQTLNTMGQGCSVAVIKPYPLQFSGRGKDNSPKFVEARGKLRKHWEKAGFKQARKSEYFFIRLHNIRPRADELITELEVEV